MATTTGRPFVLAVDAGQVYWAESDTGTLRRAPAAGGALETLATGLTVPAGVVAAGDYVYWLEAPAGAPGSVWKLRKPH